MALKTSGLGLGLDTVGLVNITGLQRLVTTVPLHSAAEPCTRDKHSYSTETSSAMHRLLNHRLSLSLRVCVRVRLLGSEITECYCREASAGVQPVRRLRRGTIQ